MPPGPIVQNAEVLSMVFTCRSMKLAYMALIDGITPLQCSFSVHIYGRIQKYIQMQISVLIIIVTTPQQSACILHLFCGSN